MKKMDNKFIEKEEICNVSSKTKKEEEKMKTIMFVLVVLSLVMCCANTDLFAATSDRTAAVTASGSIAGTTSLSVAPAALTYGTTSVDAFPTVPANKKIVITSGSNYNPWIMRVSTNNTIVPNKVGDTTGFGRYAKGGLAAANGSSVVPCKWVAKVGTNTTVPAVPTTASLSSFVKDQRDEDDPTTAGFDESWTAAIAPATGGYPNIAFGGPSGGFCVDPTNSAPGPTQYQGDAVTPASGVALYIAAGWATSYFTPATPAGAGNYGTSFIIDLLHE